MQVIAKNKKSHYRHQSYTAKHEHRRLHALQHHEYLISLQKNKSLYPRYDVFSENNHNNLIVHVRNDPRDELKPRKDSFLVSKLQEKIKNSMQDSAQDRRTKSRFFIRDPTSRTQEVQPMHPGHISVKVEVEKPSMVLYQQQQDKALSMEQKLRLMYLGPRKYSKNMNHTTLDFHL